MWDDMNRIVTRLLVWKAELIFTHAGATGSSKVQYSTQQQDDKEREYLLKKLHERVHWLLRSPICLLLLLPLPLSVLLWVVVLMETALVEKHTGSSSAKKHLENVVRVELILSELLLISLSEVIFCAMLIINLPLLWVTKASECSWNLLKSIFSVRSSILVRMKL